MSIAALSIANMVWQNAFMYKNSKFKQAKIACTDYSGNKNKICRQQFYTKILKSSINMLKSSLSKCNKTDKPDLCKSKIQKHIENYENEIKKKSKIIKNIKKKNI